MSGPFDRGMGMPVPNMVDPAFSIYDGGFNTPYPRLSGPPSHFDGVAFWYNPNNTEQMYDRDVNMFGGRGVALPPAGIEASGIKHRRTRSGCFTCRSRRVKCDETRPICDRCKKGNRECEFPQPTSGSKRSKHAESRSPKDQHSKHEHKDDAGSILATIADESEEEDDLAMSPKKRPGLNQLRNGSTQSIESLHKPKGMGSISKDPTSPHSTDASDSRSRDETPASSLRTVANSAEMQARQAKIKALKPDIQKYLQFQQAYMTHYHYFYKLDPTDFVHGEFIDLALEYEPLLYAVVGFAAYHYELQQSNPKLSRFLGYHSKSLSMLRRSLEKNAKVVDATLLTVLQLATFEEYIGDWVNLVGHHRAAYTMICELYSADTINNTDLGRRLFSWYARMDVTVGLMAGNETRLDRQWYNANAEWYSDQIESDPQGDVDIENTPAYWVAMNRLIGMDMATLFARFAKGDMSLEDFDRENAKIGTTLHDLKRQIESFNDGYYRVHDFPEEKVRPLTSDDIVNPYVPGGLFKGALWPLNFSWIDWYGIEQMHKYQTSMLLQQPIPPELEQLSLEMCRIYEAIERWPDAPNGAILGAHASLGLSMVFLRKDARHIMWARRKLATVERQGYIFPPKFRQKMAEMWGLAGESDSVEEWWLPHNEGNIPMLTELRKVVSERHDHDPAASVESLANVRELRAIFERLDIRTKSTVQPSSVSDSLSPVSETSGINSDRGSNAGFSPPAVGLGDGFASNLPSGAQRRKV